MADNNKKPGIWQTIAHFAKRGAISERRLAAIEDRLARFDGGADAEASIQKFVNVDSAEERRLCGANARPINPAVIRRG